MPDTCEILTNMEYNSKSSFLYRVKKFRGVGYKISIESHVTSTFYWRYPNFLVGHDSCDVAVAALLPVFSTLDKWF